ncbi:DsbA family oxidoreductase [Culicoidibacter larvae]|uniref:DsbA family protein n=1 Tax=Culicoidibacter larvae TaxID=2579976 RepID=A0A5R8QG65_9FIRM|nr:DsbA family protein [Culicoidibacter larvae]TLG76690.1 DsbA family protein [Culicoidibacter larvae]
MNNTTTIEFFHDVICSFCFPMSYRMRELAAQMPNLTITHRSFALARSEADLIAMFGSREQAKNEILNHWDHANHNDDNHRFNIEGMRAANFPFPTSMNGLLACKAAGLIGGDKVYWDAFDAIQQKLFVENQNIEDPTVIADAIKTTKIDFEAWQTQLDKPETLAAVEADFKLAAAYQIQSVPTLIVNGKYRISGAQPLENIKAAIQQVTIEEMDGASCKIVNGQMYCE